MDRIPSFLLASLDTEYVSQEQHFIRTSIRSRAIRESSRRLCAPNGLADVVRRRYVGFDDVTLKTGARHVLFRGFAVLFRR